VTIALQPATPALPASRSKYLQQPAQRQHINNPASSVHLTNSRADSVCIGENGSIYDAGLTAQAFSFIAMVAVEMNNSTYTDIAQALTEHELIA
jgi:hypothetical protein